MKKAKRSIVVVLVLVFVGTAVYLNWSYNNKEAEASVKNDSADIHGSETQDASAADDSGLYYGQAMAEESKKNDQLSSIRLSRQQARDEAISTLKTISTSEGAAKEVTDKALSDLTKLTERTVLEAELESKIIAKGYSDCVVYITDDGISVTVAGGEALTNESVAQITDAVINAADCTAQDIKISEIK